MTLAFDITATALAEAVRIVAPAIPANPLAAVLACIRIQSLDDGHIELMASDGSLAIRALAVAGVREEGECAVPGKRFRQYVEASSGGLLSIDTSARDLSIVSGKTSIKLDILSAEGFPRFPEPDGEPIATVPADALREHLARALSCVAGRNEQRAALLNVEMLADNKGLVFLASDAFRGVLSRLACTPSAAAEINIHHELASAVLAAIKASKEPVSISTSAGARHTIVSSGGVVLAASNGESHLPHKFLMASGIREAGTVLTFNRDAFAGALRQCAIATESETRKDGTGSWAAHLDFAEGICVLAAKGDTSAFHTELDAEMPADAKGGVSFDPARLTSLLPHMSARFTANIATVNDMAIFAPAAEADGEWRAMVMPVARVGTKG